MVTPPPHDHDHLDEARVRVDAAAGIAARALIAADDRDLDHDVRTALASVVMLTEERRFPLWPPKSGADSSRGAAVEGPLAVT